MPVYEKVWWWTRGHVVRRAAANPTPAARREAGSAIDERSMSGRRVSRHKRETLDPIADIRDARGDPDWAVDALALAAAGARNEGLPHILFPWTTKWSSPDVHSGVSSGESSGDEGLSGDEGSDGAVEPALVRRDASRLAVESHAEHEAHDMDVDARLVGADPRGDAARRSRATAPRGRWRRRRRPGDAAAAAREHGGAEHGDAHPARAMAALGASSNPPLPEAGRGSVAATLAERVPTPAPGRGGVRERHADAHRVSEATVSHAPGGVVNASIPAQTPVAPPVPLDGAAFRAARLRRESPARPASFVSRRGRAARRSSRTPRPDSVDLIVVHPPFLPTLSSPALPFTVSEFLRRRSVKFALGLRHLELCLEQERQLDPRRETLEVFPAGVLLVVDESALLSSDGVTERLAGLLGQAAAAAAAAVAAAGEFHYGASGVREPPPWPWAIKVHQGIFHTLMVQKLKAQRAPALPTPEGNAAREQAVWRIESALKALHALRQQGDRSVRGARLLGITWEESSGGGGRLDGSERDEDPSDLRKQTADSPPQAERRRGAHRG